MSISSSHFLNPASAQYHGYASQARERAANAATEMQALVQDKIRSHGYKDPQIDFLELIGKGAYGRVFKSKHRPTNKIVAVKIVDVDASDYEVNARDNDGAFHKFMNETSILKTLKERKARNVNLIHDAFTFDQDVWIVSEYCPGGSVHTLMRASPEPGLSERYIIPIARELAEALRWVHSVGVIHRDVKAANILICEDGRVQLCDFGVSGMLEAHTNKRTTFIGTPQYMPLELLSAEEKSMRYPHMWVDRPRYGTDMDIWSYGCTLYEMAMGEPPNGRVQGIENIARALTQKTPRLEGSNFSPDLRELVALCLTESPEDRPTIEEVQQHPCLINSTVTYPTETLKDLLEEYYFWERSGGQRASLFMAGGAAVSQPEPESEELDSWEFSTTESFGVEVENKRASMMSLNPSYASRNTTPSVQLSRSNSSLPSGMETPTIGEHPRIPPNPLLRLFDQSDSYNYLERGQMKPSEVLVAPPDLPLREHSNDSALRVSMIDLGDFDASTGTATIPTLKTIRGPNRNPHSHFAVNDYDEELDDEDHPTYKPLEDAEKRATKDWKFPGFGSATAQIDHKRRATKDWKFPGLQSGPEEDLNAKRATKDWTFPSLVTPSTADRTSRFGQLHDGWSFPSIVEAQDEDASRRGSNTRLHDSAALRAATLQVTVSAPVTPPHPTIDLGDYFPARPSTADSAANPMSPELDPDNPFGSPEGAYHDTRIINNLPYPNANNLLPNRFSFHNKSHSEPLTLEPVPSLTAPPSSTNTALHHGDTRSTTVSTSSTYDLSPEHASPPAHTALHHLTHSDDSDLSDDARRSLRDHNAKQRWKESFYNEWKDAPLFNPVARDPKQPGYHSRNKPSHERSHGRHQSRNHRSGGSGGQNHHHHHRGSSSRSKDVNGDGAIPTGPVRVGGGSGNPFINGQNGGLHLSRTATMAGSSVGHKYSISQTSSTSSQPGGVHSADEDADTSDLEADDALTRAVRALKPITHSAKSSLSSFSVGSSGFYGDGDGELDLEEVKAYVEGRPQELPPSTLSMAEGAPPEVVMEELERLLGEWTVGLGVVQRALDGAPKGLGAVERVDTSAAGD